MKKPHTTDFTTRTIMALVVDQANLDEAHARNRVLIAALAKAHGVSMEYPDDKRHLDAAETIEKIMKTIDQIETNTLAAYVELFEDSTDSELHSELLRCIGFIWEPKNATEFVQAFIQRSTS